MKKWGKLLCVGSIIIATILLIIANYISYAFLGSVSTMQEWLAVSSWRTAYYRLYIIALITLLINMIYFVLKGNWKWFMLVDVIIALNFAFEAFWGA